MADPADNADAEVEAHLAKCLASVPREIPPGKPGWCEWCEEFSPRLIKGACAPCRDLHKLP